MSAEGFERWLERMSDEQRGAYALEFIEVTTSAAGMVRSESRDGYGRQFASVSWYASNEFEDFLAGKYQDGDE